MVLGEALAGIALFNTAVAGIKQACGHAKSIGELGGLLDQLWTAEKQINQEANKRAGYSNFDGCKDVANQAIDRRLMQESLNEVRSLITLRFGADCWNEIIAEKAKREREMREAETRAALERQKQTDEWVELGTAVMVFMGIVALALFVITLVIKG